MSGNAGNVIDFPAVGSSSGIMEPAPTLQVGGTSGGNGGMDDVLKRLGNVERDVSDIRAKVNGIEAVLPHLATRADLNDLRGDMKGSLSSLETSILKWVVATGVTIIMAVIAAAKLL